MDRLAKKEAQIRIRGYTSASMKKQSTLAIILIALLMPIGIARGDAPLSGSAVKKKQPYPQYVHARVSEILDGLVKDSNYDDATAALQALFDQAVLFSPDRNLDCIREADFAFRLVSQLSNVPQEKRDQLLPYLRKHLELAQTLAFLIRSDKQKPAPVYEMLDTLRAARGDKLDKYPTLTAAICVVHARKRTINANENRATSADAVDIFDYYVRNENRMFFGIKNVPAELLIYVVDTTASIPEMEWALNKYGGNREVGKLFFTIKYDYDYLKSGDKKKLTVAGFNLQNILAYGGVCVDQSYFATTVGKAIGVPSAMDTGSSADAGHAWAGYLQYDGRTAAWNFNCGRYQSFQGVEGSVQDPQIRQDIPDCQVSLLGEMIGTRAVDRQNTVALTDAADELTTMEVKNLDIAPPPAGEVAASTLLPKPRARDTAAKLGLIELALHQSVAYTPAWFEVRDLAIDKKLTKVDKQHWSDLLLRLGAKKYPDFTLSILLPMVQTIEDPREQDALLSNIKPLFASRMDLSASILMTQAALWKSQNDDNRAGQCYMEVVERYCNDGPFVLAALAGAEKMLEATNRADKVVTLYQDAWNRTKKPGDWAPDFVAESNWYRIGKIYAERLKTSGALAKAADVEATLGGKGA
jgi:hypothetical protein